jgi:glycosyltransferase involved in cell wall biosynthesis
LSTISKPRYWTINGRFLAQGVTGVQRYAREIVNALDALLAEGHPLGQQLDLELVAPARDIALPRLRSIGTRKAGPLDGHLWEQLVLPFHARGGILNLGNTGSLLRRRQIVCIHDVNTMTFPQSYSFGFRALYHAMLPMIGRRAAMTTTVSNYSADQIVHLGVAAREKLRIMPNGCEHVQRWRPQHSPVTKAVAGLDTIVVLGSLAPHKNIGLLLSSTRDLAAHGFKIAVVGNLDRKVFQRTEFDPGSNGIAWLGSLSDNELAALLGDSLCLAFPSLAEGFGLPPLEAMALGCPVVVSDCASLPEVCGDAALYASAHDPQEWLKCFLALRNNRDLRDRQIAKGTIRARRYQWRASAELYLQAMAHVDRIYAPRDDFASAQAQRGASSR